MFHALHVNCWSRLYWRSARWLVVIIARTRSVFRSGRRPRVSLDRIQIRLHLFIVEYRERHVFSHNTERTILITCVH